jgi:hypothetical protein
VQELAELPHRATHYHEPILPPLGILLPVPVMGMQAAVLFGFNGASILG